MITTARPSPSCRLDAQAIATYRRNGFIHLGRIVDEALLAELRDDEAFLHQWSPPGEAGTVFRALIARHCPAVRRLALDGPQLEAVSSLVGPDVALWWNQFVTKLPESDPDGGIFAWHQDNGYVDVSPGDNLTVWLALDDVDIENGCVWVVPGSHRGGLLPHTRPSESSWHLSVPVTEPGIPVPLRAGEAVLFSAYTLHRSLANRTRRPRRALFLEYAHADAVLPARDAAPVWAQPEAWVVRGRASLPQPGGAA